MSDTSYSRAILETDTDPDTLAIRLRVKRQPVKLVFVGLWLCGWAAGEVSVLLALFWFGMEPIVAAFMLIWLTAWTLGGFRIITDFLWELGGYERLTVSDHLVTVTRAMPFRRRVTTCDASAVTNLRATHTDSEVASLPGSGLKARRDLGTLKFDYGNYTIGFGMGLDPDEGRDLAALIHRRFPQFAPRG